MAHWDAVIRILRYLKGASRCGLLYKDHCHIRVKGYTMLTGQALPEIEGLLQVIVLWLGVT